MYAYPMMPSPRVVALRHKLGGEMSSRAMAF